MGFLPISYTHACCCKLVPPESSKPSLAYASCLLANVTCFAAAEEMNSSQPLYFTTGSESHLSSGQETVSQNIILTYQKKTSLKRLLKCSTKLEEIFLSQSQTNHFQEHDKSVYKYVAKF